MIDELKARAERSEKQAKINLAKAKFEAIEASLSHHQQIKRVDCPTQHPKSIRWAEVANRLYNDYRKEYPN